MGNERIALVVTMGYSRASFVKLTAGDDAATLCRCLREAFDYFGGVPEHVLFDNTKNELAKTCNARVVANLLPPPVPVLQGWTVSDYATQHLGKPPMAMQLIDITPELILKFLAYLERERHNSVRSRNLRLTGLRAFLKFAGRCDVTALHALDRVMAVPMKRFERPLLGQLTRPEMIAVLGQPGAEWTSQRDHLLLSLLYNTGACVSEIVGVRVVDVVLDGAACVHLHGKGRKDRSVPLWKSTAAAIRAWLHANPQLRGSAALLPNRSGHPMTRCNVAQRLALAVDRASVEQPSLKAKRVSPHSLRHTTAMHLLQSDVPFNVIALWHGHESTNTTHRYVEANLEMKEKALARLEAPDIKLKRFRASDDLLKFLQTL